MADAVEAKAERPPFGQLVRNAVDAVKALEEWTANNEAEWSGWGEQEIPPMATFWRVKAAQALKALEEIRPSRPTVTHPAPSTSTAGDEVQRMVRELRDYAQNARDEWNGDEQEDAILCDKAAALLVQLSERIQHQEAAEASRALRAEAAEGLEPFANAIEPDATTMSGWRFGVPTKHEDFVRARELVTKLKGAS